MERFSQQKERSGLAESRGVGRDLWLTGGGPGGGDLP